ncbi:MAG: SLC13 family permease [Arenicellales bacterium]|nr:SLC13 family permease [Arenicellales bacterium]
MDTIVLTNEMIAVLAILAFTIFLFAFEVVRVDVAALFILVILGLSSVLPGYDGLVDPSQLFNGFASNAVISIIAVMIIGAGLDKTGVMSTLAGKILKWGGQTESRVIATISSAVAAISSFMQNIGAAALFLPVVTRISRRSYIPISRLLMPMGFCAIVGGTVTMVGSSPLILLNDLILNTNQVLPSDVKPMDTFGLFAVTPIGLVLVAVAIGYFVLLGRLVLPDTNEKMAATDNLRYFRDVYGIDGQMFELRVRRNSDLAGKQLKDVDSHGRAGWILGVRSGGDSSITPSRETFIWVGSELAIMGSREEIEKYAKQHGLELKPEVDSFAEYLSPTNAGIAEVVIPPFSDLIGKSIAEIQFRRNHRAKVLAVYRVNDIIDTDLGGLQLQAGDTLLLHSRWRDLIAMSGDQNFAVVTDFPQETFRPEKLRYAAFSFALALSLILFTDVRLSIALMVGAMGMILSGVINIEEAYRSIGWQSVFLLASLIPLGLATEQSGTAAWVAQQTLVLLGDVSTLMLQAAIAVLATIFTLVISNVGATVLLVPLAINIAIGVGADPAMFALTVALATSNSFLIPTHQVNALIMGPGGYRVVDFMRAGGVMTLLFLVVMLAMLNLVF